MEKSNNSYSWVHQNSSGEWEGRIDSNGPSLLTSSSRIEIEQKLLPDVEVLCVQLFQSFFKSSTTFQPDQFEPILRDCMISESDRDIILRNPFKKHVLAENPFFKLVLMRWSPGDVHLFDYQPYHGGVFKVITGALDENRIKISGQIQSNTFYEDDIVPLTSKDKCSAFHNSTDSDAISLHVFFTEFQGISQA